MTQQLPGGFGFDSNDESDPWIGLPVSSYQADGEPGPVYFAARLVDESGSLRIASRARPFQPGEKLDETGHAADDFTIEAWFHNDIYESGFEDQQNWPTAIEELIRQFKTGKTGTLHLPWKRNLRVKPPSWRRSAKADEHRGGEVATVSFKTDNEDNLDREAFERVSVRANMQRTVEEAVFDLESLGGWDGSIEDLTELAAQIETAINAPGEFGQAVLHAANRMRSGVQRVIGALTSKSDGRGQLNDPSGAGARGKLLDLLELAAGAAAEAQEHLPATRTVRFTRTRDIWSIATELGQSARDVMGLNSHIEDFSVIEAGVPVYVFTG
jgi:hypothetical protein